MKKPIFALQWHITSECDQRCRHCYIFNSKEIHEKKKDLDLDDIVSVLKNLMNCCVELNANPSIAFTGGDPLLRKDFFLILDAANREAKKNSFDEINIDVMGNPFHLNAESAKRLKESGVKRYQISVLKIYLMFM